MEVAQPQLLSVAQVSTALSDYRPLSEKYDRQRCEVTQEKVLLLEDAEHRL